MTSCTLCQRTDPKLLFTKQGRRFLRCRGCRLIWIDPMPAQDDREPYYQAAYEEGVYTTFAEADEIRRTIARERFEAIRELARPGRWLDVGCSTGAFLAICAGAEGVEAEGIDIAPSAVRRAREQGLRARASRVEQFEPEGAYDTITAFDVLEHLLDPHGFLETLHGWLVPEGTLALTLPDVSSAWARWLMGRHWFYFCPDDHLFYYDPRTVSQLLEAKGFSVVRVERAYKPLSLSYAAAALSLFNRVLGGLARAAVRVLPGSFADRSWRFYIGEMLVLARRPPLEMSSSSGEGSSP